MRYLDPTPESARGSIALGLQAGDFVFVSGQVGMSPSGQLVGEGDAGAQSRQALRNVETILAEAGAGLGDVVQAIVYLTDISYFADFDAAWRELMDGHRPTRAIVEAGLAWDKLLVEVQAVAYVGKDAD